MSGARSSLESRALPRPEVAAAGDRYDAFMSYSHEADGDFAPVLQAGVEKFAKPWNRMRALRIFRDNASLSAEPKLWPSIERALSGSSWLVLLASEEAARSHWVDRECEWWLGHRGADRLLLVATRVRLCWDERAGDFHWSNPQALPPSLRCCSPSGRIAPVPTR